MSKFTGFAPIQKPDDLLQKMNHDLDRMKSNPTDSYATFDFFVTAEHMLDWVYPDKNGLKDERTKKRNGNEILKIVSHIANGAKHFEVTARHHQSVDSMDFNLGGFDSGSFSGESFSSSAFQFSGITIKLSNGESKLAIDLAEEVYDFWSKELS